MLITFKSYKPSNKYANDPTSIIHVTKHNFAASSYVVTIGGGNLKYP